MEYLNTTRYYVIILKSNILTVIFHHYNPTIHKTATPLDNLIAPHYHLIAAEQVQWCAL